MKFLHVSSKLALTMQLTAGRHWLGASAFSPHGTSRAVSSLGGAGAAVSWTTTRHSVRGGVGGSFTSTTSASTSLSSSSRFFSGSSGGGEEITIQHIGKEEMEEIVEDYEEGGRDGSGYIIIDVREPDEIANTGKVSPNTINVPLGVLAQYQIFNMDEDDFEETLGFSKPSLDETIVFTCAAGIRSTHACNFAAQSGHSKLINYRGGANEWFS